MIAVELRCCGCDATAGGARLRERFHGQNGGSGWGRWVMELTSVPDGWVPFDPWTHVTYCPECFSKIEQGEPDGRS